MEFKPKVTVCAVMLVLLLLSSYDGGSVGLAEARICTGKSQHHSFPCISDKSCTKTCLSEHGAKWTAGSCKIRRCTCQREC